MDDNYMGGDELMTRDQALDAITATNGRWFGMVARTGVSKYVTGTGMKFDPLKKGLVVVWEPNSRGYRMIPLDSVHEIRYRAG
jgi:hypothetical protein